MNLSEKRYALVEYAKKYLETREKTNFCINDGIFHSGDIDSNKFLMFASLVYSKEEYPSIFSLDIDISCEERKNFINSEYSKIKKVKKSDYELGKKVLDDSEKYYIERYTTGDTASSIEEVSRKINF